MARSLSKRLLTPFFEKFWVAFNNRIPHVPSITGKFFPHDVNSKAFIVEKVDPATMTIVEPGLPGPQTADARRHSPNGLDDYLFSGKRDWTNMMKILSDAGFALDDGMSVLDFGCSTGRVLRYFKDDAERVEFWGVDIHTGDIDWCKSHLGTHFKFTTTTTLPHLPFEDNSFDLVYAGSLFTHIDDLADSWFLELRRVMKPGGLCYVTVHDNHSIELMETTQKNHPMAKAFAVDEHYPSYVKRPYAMFTIDRSMGSQVFYDLDWLLNDLRNAFEVVSVTLEAYGGYQTGILLRKKAKSTKV